MKTIRGANQNMNSGMRISIVFLALIASSFILAGCVSQPETTTTQSVGCPEDARVCDDGSIVVRVAPTCEFAACPMITTTTIRVNKEAARGIINESDGMDEASNDLDALEE